MRVGYARADITPPVGIELTGFVAREGPASGIHDRLYARALVFEEDGALAALVTVDLIGLGRNLVHRVRDRTASATSIPQTSQLFACTHTHGGPETGLLTSIARSDLGYLQSLEESLVEVVTVAAGRLAPGRLGWGVGSSEMGRNRVFARDGLDGPIDPTVTVVRIAGASGEPVATVVNYACHATAAGPVRLVNADYPGALVALLEAAGCGPTLFVNGPGADVNPRSEDRRGLEEASLAGATLAEDALRVWQGIKLGDGTGIRGDTAEVDLPLAEPPGPEEAAEIASEGLRLLEPGGLVGQERKAVEVTHLAYSGLLAQYHFGRADRSLLVRSEVQVLVIGPIALVALPGESFSSAGRAVRSMSGRPTVIAGWANDVVGYLADEATLERGGYEVDIAHRYYGLPSRFSARAQSAMLDACGWLLERLGAG